MMLQNETETDSCIRICLTNFTLIPAETLPPTTTEMAYIEGATAREHIFLKNSFN